MSIDFPDSPTLSDIYTVGDKSWIWNGVVWKTYTSNDHGDLAGLEDDDHSQYLLADGTRGAATLTVNGDLIVDTNTLFVDASANEVGINTIVPSAALDVVGNTELNGNLSVVGGSSSTISFRSNSIATAVDDGGTSMGILGGAKVYSESITSTTTVTYSSDAGATGGVSPSAVSYSVDARREGAIAVVTGTADFDATSAGYNIAVFELEVNGVRQPDQGIISEGVLGTGRMTVSKTWIVSLPTDSTTLLNLHFWKTVNSGTLTIQPQHTSLQAVVFG